MARCVTAVLIVGFFLVGSFYGSGIISAEEPQPWFVTGNESYLDAFFFLENDIIVESGGLLEFNNCTIEFSDPNSAVGIEVIVQEGGELRINNSHVYGETSPLDEQTTYRVLIYGAFYCSECVFENMDGCDHVGGIQIYSDEVVITGCEIRDSNSAGIYVCESSPIISGNIVTNSSWGFYLDGCKEEQSITEFSDGNSSVSLDFVGPGLYASTFTWPLDWVQVYSPWICMEHPEVTRIVMNGTEYIPGVGGAPEFPVPGTTVTIEANAETTLDYSAPVDFPSYASFWFIWPAWWPNLMVSELASILNPGEAVSAVKLNPENGTYQNYFSWLGYDDFRIWPGDFINIDVSSPAAYGNAAPVQPSMPLTISDSLTFTWPLDWIPVTGYRIWHDYPEVTRTVVNGIEFLPPDGPKDYSPAPGAVVTIETSAPVTIDYSPSFEFYDVPYESRYANLIVWPAWWPFYRASDLCSVLGPETTALYGCNPDDSSWDTFTPGVTPPGSIDDFLVRPGSLVMPALSETVDFGAQTEALCGVPVTIRENGLSISMPRRASVQSAELTIDCGYTVTPSSVPPFLEGIANPGGLDCGFWWEPSYGYTKPVLYAADATNGVLAFDYEGNLLFQTGLIEDEDLNIRLSSPSDVCYSEEYLKIFAVDGNHIDVLQLYQDQVPYLTWSFKDQLRKPEGIYCLGDENLIFIADSLNGLVVYQGFSWANTVTENLGSPSDVSVTSDRIYVLDESHIDVFSREYEWLFSTDEGLSAPSKIDVGDRIFVIDDDNGVVVLDLDGSYDCTVTEGLIRPAGVATDSILDKVFVQDNDYEIIEFNASGILNPSVDLGCDGDVEWSWVGVYDGEVELNSSNSDLVEELQSHVRVDGVTDYQIPISVRADCAGVISLSSVCVNYTLQPHFSNNYAMNNHIGVSFGNVSIARASELTAFANDIGIHFDNSSPQLDNCTSLRNNEFDLSIVNSSNPVLVNVDYDPHRIFFSDNTDSDNDGLSDSQESWIYGTDFLLNDSDADGFLDGWEVSNGCDPLNATDVAEDLDGDMLGDVYEIYLGIDAEDPDTDDDGLVDGFEYHVLGTNPLLNDSDSDGLSDREEYEHETNPLLSDSDSDGIIDSDEMLWNEDIDDDSLINAMDVDSDGDGLEDGDERRFGTNMTIADTDADQIDDGPEYDFWLYASGTITPEFLPMNEEWTNFLWPEGWKVADAAYLANVLYSGVIENITKYENGEYQSYVAGMSVQDRSFPLYPGLDTYIWAYHSFDLQAVDYATADLDYDHIPNLLDVDSDNDGVIDGREIRMWGSLDSDSDSMINVLDIDSDNDGISDSDEIKNHTSAISPDTDCDGLSDPDEIYVYYTDPVRLDTDGDGLNDGAEIDYWTQRGVDPITEDTDNDGYANILDIDSDNDTLPDGWELAHGLNPMSGFTTPSCPNNLTADPGPGEVALSWDPPDTNGDLDILHYSIYCGINPGYEEIVANVSADTYEYVCTDLNNGIDYYFKVCAVNSLGEGDFSFASARPGSPPTAPLNLAAVPGNTIVDLEWEAPIDNGTSSVIGYNIYVGTDDGGGIQWMPGVNVDAETLNYTVTGLENEVLYSFKVCAYSVYGESPSSNVVEAMPHAEPFQNIDSGIGYNSIQEAIDAPETMDNHTIYILSGTYDIGWQTVTVSKSLTILGEDRDSTVLMSPGVELFAIEADCVTISGLTLMGWSMAGIIINYGYFPENIVISGNRITNCAEGIKLSGCQNVLIYNNIFSDHYYDGVLIQGSATNVVIESNDFFDNDDAIRSYGASYLDVKNNTIWNNTGYGILVSYLGSSIPQMISIEGNTIRNCGYNYKGISLCNVKYGTIIGNSLDSNEVAVRVSFNSEFCEVYYNNFTNNGVQVDLDNSPPVIWDDQISFGNYWDDYDGEDLDQDGVGDTPYLVASPDVYDNFPLMYPWGETPPESPRNLTGAVGGRYNTVVDEVWVDLNWDCPGDNGSSDLALFRIYQGVNVSGDIEWSVVDEVSPQELEVRVYVTQGATCYFGVTAVNMLAEGPMSNVTEFEIPYRATRPEDFQAFAEMYVGIVLTWSPPEDDGGSEVIEYIIHRTYLPDNWWDPYDYVDGNTFSYIDSSVNEGDLYYYRICAVTAVGPGELAGSAARAKKMDPSSMAATVIEAEESSFISNDIDGVLLASVSPSICDSEDCYFTSSLEDSAQVEVIHISECLSATYEFDDLYYDGGLPPPEAYDPPSVILMDSGDPITDYLNGDEDGDTLENWQELGNDWSGDESTYPTSPYCNDTDGDGLLDAEEVAFWNNASIGCLSDSDDDGLPNLIDSDSDDDGILDGIEKTYLEDMKSENPEIACAPFEDSDDDGFKNILDNDSDDDQLLDGEEIMIVTGNNIDEVVVFPYFTNPPGLPQQQSLDLVMPLDENGDFLPLGSGTLEITGCESGGGLFGNRYTHDMPFANVTDVASGDIDGDESVDAVAVSQSGWISILYNENNLSFSEPVCMYLGGHLTAVCIDDLDGDGMLDIAAANADNSTIIILFNDGDRVFAAPVYEDIGQGPVEMRCVKKYSYHNPYIYIACELSWGIWQVRVDSRTSIVSYCVNTEHPFTSVFPCRLTASGSYGLFACSPNDHHLYWSFGSTNHHFELQNTYKPSSIIATDLNGDGVNDIVAYDMQNKVHIILLMRSDGYPLGHPDITIYIVNAGTTSFMMDVADVNLDGDDDILIPDAGVNARIGYRGGSGILSDYMSWTTEADARSLCTGDFNGDGIPDLLVGHYGSNGRISMHPNGMFPDSPSLSLFGDEIWSYSGVFNSSVTLTNLYPTIIGYLEDRPWICDAFDGLVDGRIVVALMLQTYSQGTLRLYSEDMGTCGMSGYRLNPFDEDCDDDGLLDGEEVHHTLTNPLMPDTDCDGMNDSYEKDYWESTVGISIFSNPDGDSIDNLLCDWDSDNDGLSDYEEVVARGTDPLDIDTDDDGVMDYYDRSPLSWSEDFIDWQSLYAPGMLRLEQNITTLYYREGAGFSTAEIWDYDYAFWTGEETGDPELVWGPSSSPSVVSTRTPTDDEIEDMIESEYPDYNIINNVSCLGRDIYQWDFPRWYGGGDWAHQEQYRFRYGSYARIDNVVLGNKNETGLDDGQQYGLVKISVDPGNDQSVFIQMRIAYMDRTHLNGPYVVLPTICYSLYTSNDFNLYDEFYSMTATGNPLGNHTYEFQLRLPGTAVATENCFLESDGRHTVVLCLSPKWVSQRHGLEPRFSPMDPSSITICAFVEMISQGAMGLYARQGVSAQNISLALPPDYSTMPTESYYFGSYKVYLYNVADGLTFDQQILSDESYDAVLIVGPSVERVSATQSDIDWGLETDGWMIGVDYGYENIVEASNSVRGGSQALYDLTCRQGGMDCAVNLDYTEFTPDVEFPNEWWCVQNAHYGQHGQCYVFREKGVYNRIGMVHTDVTLTLQDVTEVECTFHDLDSAIVDERYSSEIKRMKGLQVGAVLASYGYGACLAFRDGEYVRGTTYVIQSGIELAGILKETETWIIRIDDSSQISVKYRTTKYGVAATAAVGIIEVGYNLWKYESTDDAIMKLYYVESATASAIDTLISLFPIGALAEGVWSLTILALSTLIPDPIAREICSSPGTLIVFLAEYWIFDDCIPSTFCNMAYNEAANFMTETVIALNEMDIPTRLILPERG